MEEMYLIYKYFVVVAVGIAKAFVAIRIHPRCIMSNLISNSAFALRPRKITKNLDRVCRSQDLPDAKTLLASSPV
jgi:hypothetical protein